MNFALTSLLPLPAQREELQAMIEELESTYLHIHPPTHPPTHPPAHTYQPAMSIQG
jgi:hypothetical protein